MERQRSHQRRITAIGPSTPEQSKDQSGKTGGYVKPAQAGAQCGPPESATIKAGVYGEERKKKRVVRKKGGEDQSSQPNEAAPGGDTIGRTAGRQPEQRQAPSRSETRHKRERTQKEEGGNALIKGNWYKMDSPTQARCISTESCRGRGGHKKIKKKQRRRGR